MTRVVILEPTMAKDKGETKAGKSKDSKVKGGRPPKYNASVHPQLAEAWANAGKTDKQIAEKLGIAESTLNAWKKAHPEFSESIQRGKEDPDDQVERCLFERATGYSFPAVKIFMPANAPAPVYADYTEHCPPDVAACFIWLKNRRPDKWRDKHEVEHSGTVGAGVLRVSEKMTPEEWAAVAAAQQGVIMSVVGNG